MLRLMRLVGWLLVTCAMALTVMVAPQVAAAQESSSIGPLGGSGIDLAATFDELEQALQGSSLGSLSLGAEQATFAGLAGLAGRTIERDGDVVAWVASATGEDQVDLIAFVDGDFRTAANVGPGSTVAEARRAYGAAAAESFDAGTGPETIDFVNGPVGMVFVTSLDGDGQTGTYRSGRTTSFGLDASAEIAAVLVGCGNVDCERLLGATAPAAPTAPPTQLAATGFDKPFWGFVAFGLVGGGCLAHAGARRSTWAA